MTLDITHSFPPEIIRKILLNLPVESLLRCKSVCKEWYSLISEQNFIKTHYTLSSSTNNLNYQNHTLIYTTSEQRNNLHSCPLYDVLFDKPTVNLLLLKNPLQRTQALSIVGSCNGLVCLFVVDDDYDIFLYNPSTRICNGLPFHREYSEQNWRYFFGYDESTDDYKIVEMSSTWGVKCVNIYSLKTGKWKIIGDFAYNYSLHDCGIFSNGALHWVASNDSSHRERIISLDLAKETYGEVLQPVYDECGMISLGVSGESFCVLCYHLYSHADLWVMKVYGVKDSWTKLSSFPYSNHPWIETYLRPLFISNVGNVLIECRDLVIYKSKDSSFEYLDRCSKACVVVESLVSPFPPLDLAYKNES